MLVSSTTIIGTPCLALETCVCDKARRPRGLVRCHRAGHPPTLRYESTLPCHAAVAITQFAEGDAVASLLPPSAVALRSATHSKAPTTQGPPWI